MDWPSVGVVIPTRDRPHVLRRALAAIDAQAYPGPMRIVVVYDRARPEHTLAHGGDRPVAVCANERTAGSAGARNTGILQLESDLVACCDDEDEWRPDKLAAQVEALASAPDADLVSCAVQVAYRHGHEPRPIGAPRLVGQTHIGLDRLIRSPVDAPRSSTFVIRRASLVEPGGLGLFAEDAPSSRAEDWDLLLRAARRAPVEHVDEALVRVCWRPPGHYGYGYAARISALRWMMRRHPEVLHGCAPGAARSLPVTRWPGLINAVRRDSGRYDWAALRNDRSGAGAVPPTSSPASAP